MWGIRMDTTTIIMSWFLCLLKSFILGWMVHELLVASKEAKKARQEYENLVAGQR